MAKISTDTERTITINTPLADAFRHFWDVIATSKHIPGLASCERIGKDTYRFVYDERSHGPVKVLVKYTARYEGNGKDSLSWTSTGAAGDTADVQGSIRMVAQGDKATRVVMQQTMAPEVPVPRLMHGLARPLVSRQAAEGIDGYLAKVKGALEGGRSRRRSA